MTYAQVRPARVGLAYVWTYVPVTPHISMAMCVTEHRSLPHTFMSHCNKHSYHEGFLTIIYLFVFCFEPKRHNGYST